VKLDSPIKVKTIFSGGSEDSYDYALVPVSSLMFNDDEARATLEGNSILFSGDIQTVPSIVGQEFGSPYEILASNSKNPVVKSFESSQGRGLAGAITSLTYEWLNEGYTWETTQGRRAPKVCKVSINFSPIHDIPMGLDSDGFARAVPYPVGSPTRATFFPELYENDEKLK
jgi:hypothetical protein